MEGLSEEEVANFIRATGGGKGFYEKRIFIQTEKCSRPSGVAGIGFGRIKFVEDNTSKPYIRVPLSRGGEGVTSRLLLHFVQSVWELPRPNIVVSISGGAVDFPKSENLERVLHDLVSFAERSGVWIVTGGMHSGIMKYIGRCFKFGEPTHPKISYPSSFRRSGSLSVWVKDSATCFLALWGSVEK